MIICLQRIVQLNYGLLAYKYGDNEGFYIQHEKIP